MVEEKVTERPKAVEEMAKRVDGLYKDIMHDAPYDNDPFVVVSDKVFDEYYDCLKPEYRFQHAFIGLKNIMCQGVPIVKRSWVCQKEANA